MCWGCMWGIQGSGAGCVWGVQELWVWWVCCKNARMCVWEETHANIWMVCKVYVSAAEFVWWSESVEYGCEATCGGVCSV